MSDKCFVCSGGFSPYNIEFHVADGRLIHKTICVTTYIQSLESAIKDAADKLECEAKETNDVATDVRISGIATTLRGALKSGGDK